MLSLRHFGAAGVLVFAAGAAHAQQPVPAPEPSPYPAPPSSTTPAEPFPPTGTGAPPQPTAAPAPPPEPSPFPDRLSTGKFGGFFQVGGLIQVWGVGTHVDNTPGTDTTFRLRRVEFRARGEFVPKLVRFNVMFDVAKIPAFTAATSNVPVTDTGGTPIGGTVAVPQPTLGADRSPLQDVWITYVSDYADFQIGQFKIPVGLEGLQPGTSLLFPERNRVTREFGDRRDIGFKVEKKIADVFYYNVGIYNGQGQNVLDADRRKDLGLRLEAYPIKGLTIGAVAYGTVGGRDLAVRDRLEADLRLEVENLIIQGEYIHGWTGAPNRRLEGQGVYGAVGYTFLERFQPVFRVGMLDVNTDDIAPRTELESGPVRFFEGGINYLLRGHDVKFDFALAHFSQEHGADTTEGTVQAQLAY
jgi:hypothetical protein